MDMPLPRYKQVNTEITPYYHCISRCVRQSYLCGKDHKTGVNYEHRRKWIKERLHTLSEAFAIDLCAYAIMHNHVHTVLHIAKSRAEGWSMDEVLLRWRMFYKCPPVVQRYLKSGKEHLTESELTDVKALTSTYRNRLTSISWFMKLLNEYVARRANKEDECKGYFWERRFHSQAILDDKALASVMAYVDLNPIRARIATTLEGSSYTTIQYRLNAAKANKKPKFLMSFNTKGSSIQAQIPFTLNDYIALLKHSMNTKTVGSKPNDKRSFGLLKKLGINEKSWRTVTSNFETLFTGPAGTADAMTEFAVACGRSCRPNVRNAEKYLS